MMFKLDLRGCFGTSGMTFVLKSRVTACSFGLFNECAKLGEFLAELELQKIRPLLHMI